MRRRRSSVDFLRERLPAHVGRYLEGVQFPPARRSCLEGSSATVCRVRSSLSCASGSQRASTAAPRTSCLPSGGGVSLSAGVSGAVGSSSPRANFLELRNDEVRRILLLRTRVNGTLSCARR